MSILSEAVDRIDDQIGKWVKGTNLFGDVIPEHKGNPNNSCFVFQTSGGAPEWGIGSRSTPIMERPGLQIIVRSKIAAEAYSDITNLFANVPVLFREVDLGGVRWHSVLPTSSPALLNRDNEGRVLYVVNFNVMKQLSSS